MFVCVAGVCVWVLVSMRIDVCRFAPFLLSVGVDGVGLCRFLC